MDEADKERIISRYNARFAKYTDSVSVLASGTEERRNLRFQVLFEVGLEPGCSVLDLGCGFGDFYGYLRGRGLECRYVGYDINPRLVEAAKGRYPSAEFHVKDIQVEEFPQFDFIVSSNAFNLRLGGHDNYVFIGDILKRCYDHAGRGVAVDLLTSYVDFETPEAFHYSPERVFSIAKGLTKRVSLRHDYPLYEFCVYMYPDFRGWRA